MAERLVGVRLAAFGGQALRAELTEVGRTGKQAFEALETSGRRGAASLQNVGYQVQDFAVQVAGGTAANRALAQQLPQLLSGFGLFGVLAGTAAAIFIPLVGLLFEGADATAALVEEMTKAGGTIGSVESAVSALTGVQTQYNDALRASGGASSASASLVISNTAKEFEARKQILAVELELLRIRGSESQRMAQNLAEGIHEAAQVAMDDVARVQAIQASSRIVRNFGSDAALANGPAPSGLSSLQTGFNSVSAAPAFNSLIEERQLDFLALRKLNAEATLTGLTITRTEELLGTQFETVAAGADAVTTAAHGAGGAIKAIGDAAEPALETTRTELDGIIDALTAYANQAESMGEGIGKVLVGSFNAAGDAVSEFVKTGKLDFSGLITSMLADLAKLAVQQAVLGPLANALGGALGGSGILGGIGKVLAGKYHDGGMVGAGAPVLVDWRAFEGAPRYHTGGGFGLRMDEQAAVLQKGERVLTRAQTRAYDGGGGVTININARDANSFRQSQAQIGADIARAVAAGRRSM